MAIRVIIPYHLRTLARYGFVEEDPDRAADGRERPWRARMLAFSLNDVPGKPAATRVASRLLALGWWDWDHEILRRALPDFRKLGVEEFLEKYETARSAGHTQANRRSATS